MSTSAAIRKAIDDKPQLPDPTIRRALRERAGLSQQEVAAAVGVSRESVTKYEHGERTPTGPRRIAYAQALREMARP